VRSTRTTVAGVRAVSRSHGRGWTAARVAAALSIVAGVLALATALTGLLWTTGDGGGVVTTVWGERVVLHGQGLYRHDSVFVAGSNLGSDSVTLLLGLPLLVVAVARSRSGSRRGQLLRVGVLGYLLYYGTGCALGAVAYNELFLLYVALFSASLFAVVTTVASIDPAPLTDLPGRARRWIGGFMIASGGITLVIWLMDPIDALINGTAPATLGTHTTLFTNALDVAVIVPAAGTAGVLILRSRPYGEVIAASLLVLEAMLLPLIVVTTIIQLRLGLSFTPAEIAGPIGGFLVLGVLAVAVLHTLLRHASGGVVGGGGR